MKSRYSQGWETCEATAGTPRALIVSGARSTNVGVNVSVSIEKLDNSNIEKFRKEGKIDAIKALNLRNKLNNTNALELAKKFFKLQGHKEENFHPAEFGQSSWSGGDDDRGGKLPYYEIRWYRKDVAEADIESGKAKEILKSVRIEVSGIDSHLISYSKGMLPIGSDF